MRTTAKSLRPRNVALWLLLALLAGCAIRSPDVGAVVQAPRVQLPPVPAVVQQTQPKPPGYFQRALADFFSSKPEAPTR